MSWNSVLQRTARAGAGSPRTKWNASEPTAYRSVITATETKGACVRSRPVVSP